MYFQFTSLFNVLGNLSTPTIKNLDFIRRLRTSMETSARLGGALPLQQVRIPRPHSDSQEFGEHSEECGSCLSPLLPGHLHTRDVG